MTDTTAQRTPLFDLHRRLGAKMVPFAGYAMPVHYPAGIIREHLHTRRRAGLFDVSHMGQARVAGEGTAEALERLLPGDIIGLAPGRQRYSFFTTDKGGILDDLMVANLGDHFSIVLNAACKNADFKHLQSGLGPSIQPELRDDLALLALQGPEAAAVMERLGADLDGMCFMAVRRMEIAGHPCTVSRSGYTGEDGFEISLAGAEAEALAEKLLADEAVEPAGLGARDSLRLEAGLCLYGHDIDTTTTPVEAGLNWAIPKVRRRGGEREGGFPGADVILAQLPRNVERLRVGIQPEGKAPVREGAALTDQEGTAVGKVTSGGFSPSLGRPIAMGYVRLELAAPGMALHAVVRGRPLPVTVTKMPFVEQRYYRG